MLIQQTFLFSFSFNFYLSYAIFIHYTLYNVFGPYFYCSPAPPRVPSPSPSQFPILFFLVIVSWVQIVQSILFMGMWLSTGTWADLSGQFPKGKWPSLLQQPPSTNSSSAKHGTFPPFLLVVGFCFCCCCCSSYSLILCRYCIHNHKFCELMYTVARSLYFTLITIF